MSLNQQNLSPFEEIKTLKHRNRKNHNQYFTPEFAVEKALSFVPEINFKNIIDPAVGNGVFLKVASNNWSNAKLYGVDIDISVIQNLKKINLSNSIYFTGDSLLKETWESPEVKKIISNEEFDLVVGNPPFSSWFHRIESKEILSNYELAKNNGNLKRSQAIEILFLEIFIKLAKGKGFIVIVLPDGIISNPQYQYVREFILKNTKVLHIINLPRNVFEATSAKTSILILEKQKRDDLSYIAKLYDLEKTGEVNNIVKVTGKNLINRMDYHYYSNLQKSSLQELKNNGITLKSLKDFVIYCKTGKTLYGKERKFSDRGLRFLHTTSITDIGINYKKDEKFILPNSRMDFKNAHTKISDILIARVGNGCVGNCAIVSTEKDLGIISDCIYIIRVKGISPYFVTIFLKTKFGREWFNTIKHGSATTSITKDEILSIPIPLLHRNSQKAIERRYKKIITEFHKNGNKEVSKIHQCFESLIKNVEEKIANGKNI